MNDSFIHFNRPSIGDEEIAEVADTLRSGWLTSGAKTQQFEREFAAYVQAPHALAVNSCTAGLHLALAALRIGPGDEVITTPLTFCATVNTILHVGATPVLADIGEHGNIDPESIRRCITGRTRAIVPVHMAGLPCDMNAIWQIADEYNLFVIEDAAHAVGTYHDGAPIGAAHPLTRRRSDVVAFSFYATKNLTTGEGGMVTTHDAALLERMRVLCLHGISKDAWNRYSDKGNWHYDVVEVGFKYNLSDILSAIGIHQLRKQEAFIRERTRQAALYRELLEDCKSLILPADTASGRHCWHLFCVRVRMEVAPINRSELMARLRERGIGASVHFIPIPLHAAFREVVRGEWSETLKYYEGVLSLPMYPGLTDYEIRRVAAAVIEETDRLCPCATAETHA